jgi:uncharacterized membrane protein
MSGVDVVVTLSIVAAIGCGLIAGVFYAFSSFVMRGLDELGAARAVETMQSINRTVLHPSFLGVFLGTGVLCLGLVVAVVVTDAIAGAGPLVVGAALYLVGTILVTGIFNVPMNERLATIDAGGPAAETEWETYFRRWVVWNHVRTAAAVVASVAMVVGLP